MLAICKSYFRSLTEIKREADVMPGRQCLRRMASGSQLRRRHLRAERRMPAVLFVVRYPNIAYMIQSVVCQVIKVMQRCLP